MTSVQYDSVELQNTTYIPRTVEHESAPQRLIDLVKLARQDGSIIIDDTFGEKYITIPGILKGTSLADLEGKIDSFKELISRKDKNLDISFAGGTRRYVARSVSHEFDRDFYHLLYVPYTVKFYVVGSIGKDTSETTLINHASIVSGTTAEAVTLAGSYPPKPRHKLTIVTRGNADVARITNNTTGDYIEVDLDGFINGDYVELDEQNQTVKKNGSTNLDYRGKFPGGGIGAVTYTLTISGSGSTLDQQQTVNANVGNLPAIYSNGAVFPLTAQSFVPAVSGRIYQIDVFLEKSGTPGGNVHFYIAEDDNGKPGGPVGTAEFEKTFASISGTSWQTIPKTAGSAFLVAGRRYWLVHDPVDMTGSDSSNWFAWYDNSDPTGYASGKAMTKQATGAGTWADGVVDSSLADGTKNGSQDYMFKIYMGDGAAASYSVTWQAYYTKKYL